MMARLETLSHEQMTVFSTRQAELEEKRQTLVRQYHAERQELIETQQSFWQDKQQEWQGNFNNGRRSLFDRLTGRRKQIEERNQLDAWQIEVRQQQERDTLIFEQLEIRRNLQTPIERLEALKSYRWDGLEHDRLQYQAMRGQCLKQLKTQRQERNRDTAQPRQRDLNWTP